MDKYEGHLTLFTGHKDVASKVGSHFQMHYSEISGWDEMGSGRHAFLTTHDTNLPAINDRLMQAKFELEEHGLVVKRIKIEMAIFDERYV